jgi:hypothetical protein
MIAAAAAAVVVMGGGMANAATGWAVQPTPSIAGQSLLKSVSCVSATNCTAVGYYNPPGSIAQTLAEHWDGSTWSVVPTPNPTGETAESAYLEGVSCASASSCMAVGYWYSDNTPLALAEYWNGSTWALQTVETTQFPRELYGVSCHGATSCTAVGTGTVAEHWNGTAWRTEALSFPAGTADQNLYGVSCASDSDCMAVGQAETSAGIMVTLAEQRTGLTWSASEPVNPSSAYDTLTGVSCRTTTNCVAVGQDDNTSGTGVTLAESWNGSAWSAGTTPNPATSTGASLAGVSCALAATCTAVGSYTTASGVTLTLAEHLSGGKWVLQPTPNIPGWPVRNLAGVSCALAATCTAAGSIDNPKAGGEQTLAEAN